MEQIIEELKKRKPSFVSSFEIEEVSNSILPKKWNKSDLFTTKNISCTCGQKQQFLLSSQSKETKGLFKKKEVTTHLAPIQIKCGACNKITLLLNPEIHGWSGEFRESAALIGSDEPQMYSTEPGDVYVNYSYQGVENYQDLIEDNIPKPENYFDTVTIYFKPAGSDSLDEVVSYVCT